MNGDELVPPHGGYRRLKSFQLAQLIYDVTVHFCDRYVGSRSRTHDQMVQAARSGVQNIAEGSQASGTSKKTELKLTNVARASLEELRLDFEDFLRQKGFAKWPADHPALRRFKARRCATLHEVRLWVRSECERRAGCGGTRTHGQAQTDTDEHGHSITGEERGADAVPPVPEMAANAALSLLNLCCHLLDRQIAAQAAAFERDGGFTERLYRRRREVRNQRPKDRP